MYFTGNSLLKVGQTQQKLSDCKRDFVMRSTNEYLTPLKSFLDNDIKTIAVSNVIPVVLVLKAVQCWCHERRTGNNSVFTDGYGHKAAIPGWWVCVVSTINHPR